MKPYTPVRCITSSVSGRIVVTESCGYTPDAYWAITSKWAGSSTRDQTGWATAITRAGTRPIP